MKIVAISDTHGKHNEVHIPDGDVLIHAGDCTDDIGMASLRSFLQWFAKQPHKHKIFIAGNHDGAFEKWPKEARDMVRLVAPGVHYLQEESVVLDGVKFYGLPHTPAFCNWFFNVDRKLMFVQADRIPSDTNILISHGPPFGHLDVSGFDNANCGCREIYRRVLEVKPDLHIFGHIHHSHGTKKLIHDDGTWTWLFNASCCNERYKPVNKPWVYDYLTP